ncbi:MAG TPA: GMC family oxidoreductase [Gaiellaceae bacterium]|nr:GMC family oxidoreductase [Gaiellaceae bacterium]
MAERFDVVVVGSGAGGGVVAGELAQAGRSVLLLETGPHKTAADFTRWEAKAAHDMWWPIRFALIDGGAGGVVGLVGGRCVGGSTTINTKVALRAHAKDLAKWKEASGLDIDLMPNYERVEQRLGVRERTDWSKSVRKVEPAFAKLGAPLEAVRSYTDANCVNLGACLQGCPTNGGKSTQNTYIADAHRAGLLDLRPDSNVERVVIESGEAKGVEYTGPDGTLTRVDAGVVVVAAGTLNSPQLLMRSGVTLPLVGRNLGFHPARLVYGLFDEPQDAHMVYPITSHSMAHQHDDDGGFVIEATTIQDPIGFTTTMEDENGPMYGQPLVDAAKKFRNWIGLLAMSNDDNNGRVSIGENGEDVYEASFTEAEKTRFAGALEFTRDVLREAGATQLVWSGLITTHMQGSNRMGTDPDRSVLDENQQVWDVRRLYVGDGSVMPRTLSVNPSLTIMALADRLALHLDEDTNGYLS